MHQLKVSYVREPAISELVGTPSDVHDLVHKLIGQADREHVLVFHLNTRHKVVSYEVVSIGTINASLVHPREVFKGAILANAATIILAHNHPTGDTSPSAEDNELTQRIKAAGDVIGIPLLDHVIVGDGTYSYSREGLL